jgi:aminopeptidase N
MQRLSRATIVTVLALGAGAAPASAAGGIGSPGAGDPLYPAEGNGGIDVQDYGLKLAYDPATRQLDGSATLRIRATQDLKRFNLDLRGFHLGTVTVDRRPAGVRHVTQELEITPARTLRRGDTFTVVVPYSGEPQTVTDPDDSIEGWVPTADGATVVGEPQGSPAWYPVNDTPRDKATYTIQMTVPNGLTAVGNGALEERSSRHGRTTFRWRERYPMAPYLATITLGRFKVSTGRTRSGIPIYVAVDPTQADAAAPVVAQLPAMVSFLENLYGRYPFETVGGIVDDSPDLGYSLETQTKPVYDQAPDELTQLHELSHMWFGDAVTLGVWPDIWLHEGFATFSEWIWTERQGRETAAQTFDELASTPASDEEFWNPPPGNPGDPALLFDGTIYDRGGMTLEALRQRIGDKKFFTVLRRWYAEHRYGTATTAEFIALAERVSGRDLGAFFDEWLYTPGKPAELNDRAAAPRALNRSEAVRRRR